MNIMVLADCESKALYDFYDPKRMEGIDLIISCGDLKAEYLSFFATLCPVPLLYVMGNHDTCYDKKPPEGCICIEDDIYVHNGVRILGVSSGCKISVYGTADGAQNKEAAAQAAATEGI